MNIAKSFRFVKRGLEKTKYFFLRAGSLTDTSRSDPLRSGRSRDLRDRSDNAGA